MSFRKRITKSKIFVFGGGTFVTFLVLLLSLSYLGINTEYSEDIICGSKCVSYFNITLTNYSLCLGSTFKGLYFDKNISYEIYKADLRYSRNNPDRWKLYNFTANKCLEKGKKYEFKLIGYKNPSDTIKWGVNLQGKDIDPYWYGTSGIVINPFQPNPERAYYTISIDRGIKITGEDWMARYSIHFRVNNQIYNWDAIPSSIKKNPWVIQTDENTYKYGYDFSNISTNIKNNLQNVILHLEEIEGLTLDDIRKEGNTFIIKDKVYISHDDILVNYTIPIINKTDIVIGNLANNFIANGDGTWNITFDPTITITESNVISISNLVNVTAESVNSYNYTHLNISTISPYDSLIFYLNFDKDTTDTLVPAWKAVDWSKNNNDGTSGGNVSVNTSIACPYDNCAHFTGNTNSYIRMTPAFNFTGNATIMLWTYYPVNTGTRDYYLGCNSTSVVPIDTLPFYWYRGDSQTYLRVTFRNETNGIMSLMGSTDSIRTPSGANNLTSGWHHVALVFNGTSLILYYDGAFDEQRASFGTSIAPMTSKDWQISSHHSSYNDAFYLDEVMMFNTGLSASQISAIYNNQSSRFVEKGTQSLIIDGCINKTTGLTCAAIYDETACDEQTGECLWVVDECVNLGGSPKCTNFLSNQTCVSYDDTQPENSACIWRFGEDTAENRVNVTTLFENNSGSLVNLSVGYKNTTGWFYTSPQTLNFNTSHIFNISSTINGLSKLSLNYTQIAGNSSNPFYSPIMYGDIILDTWNVSEEEEGITACQMLINPGTYIQTANIVPNNDTQCIAIIGKNITYDCNGFKIDNSTYSGIGIYATQFNATIKNCNITVNNYAIELTGYNSSVINNTLRSTSNYGLYLLSQGNHQIMNNTISRIRFSASNNSVFTNNNLIAGSYGLYISSSYNNLFTTGNYSGNSLYDIYMTGSLNNTFLNITYSTELLEDTSSLIRKWYYRAYVNDTNGNNVSNANVTAYNISNSYNFNLTTDNTGYTQLGEIIDYINNETKNYYSLYNITAINSSYYLNSHTYNVTSNQSNYKDVFTLNSSVVAVCNMSDVIVSVWAWQSKFIDGFNDEFCTSIPINATFGEQIWSYANGRFISGIGTSSPLPSVDEADNCNLTDIAISMWCYSGEREINGIDTSTHPYVPVNSTIGEYVWGWIDQWKYVNRIIG